MSDQRRRRRSVSDEDGEPPFRRRRYNTRSAVREAARRREDRRNRFNWNPNLRIMRIPFLNFGDYTRVSSGRSSSSRTADDSRNGRRHSESRNRSGGSTPATGSSSGSSQRTSAEGRYARPTIRRQSSRRRTTESPRNGDASSGSSSVRGSTSSRTYAAMSTGGRLNSTTTTSPPVTYQSRNYRDGARSGSTRSVARNRPLSAPMRALIAGRINDGRRPIEDRDFTDVMRSLELVRSQDGQRRNPRPASGPLSPRPSRGSNIVNRSSSSRERRSRTNASSPVLAIEDIIGIPSSSRRTVSTARMSTGVQNRVANGSSSRANNAPASNGTRSSNTARTRIATNRVGGDHITYNMTHTGGRLNIRVAFGTEDDESGPNERLFSISGDSDATTYLNSISDVDMSADDVFYSDTDRVESDSGDSVESGSTATPHSLVSLSLNALHPSPTPSLSSAETNVNMDLDEEATTEEVEEDDDDDDEPTTDEVDEEETTASSPTLPYTRTVGNPIIFLHNNISVHLLSSMAELADTFTALRDRFQTVAQHDRLLGIFGSFRGFTPPRNYPEPTRRRVPEGVDCQRAKLIDELNSNTSECVICTDTIKAVDTVWPCNNCFNIFHLPCIRKWAKTNRANEVGGAWICPVCRRPKFCTPNKLRYRCLCGRLQKPKPMPGVTPHCCGKPCKHNCGLLCHPGPCKMTEAEAAAFAQQEQQSAQPQAPATSGEPATPDAEVPPDLDDLDNMSTADIQRLTKMVDAEVRLMKSERNRLWDAKTVQTLRLKENKEKIKLYKTLPYLVANVVEILDPLEPSELEESSDMDPNTKQTNQTVIVKTSMRQVLHLPIPGLVDLESLKPGDLVGVNKDSLLILDKLPWEVDPRVKVMEMSEKPTDSYTDIGGLDTQIQELIEAIVLPMTQKDKFEKLGIIAPKGVLMYGPPGTGKTLLARACAAQTKAKFLKLAATQLVQMFIGDGAKIVRDAFQLARENAPTIIFIDEIDAIGTKRFDSAKVGDREVQRTMMELLNQLDGFTPNIDVKVIAATNRIDSLDPALIRSGRIDKKIEFPEPGEEARTRILHIHSRKMKLDPGVVLEEVSKSTDGFNGAQLKAVCVEAGMASLRRNAEKITHEDFMDAILEVQAKKRMPRSCQMFS